MNVRWIASLTLAAAAGAAQAGTITVLNGSIVGGLAYESQMTWMGSYTFGAWAKLQGVTWTGVGPTTMSDVVATQGVTKSAVVPTLMLPGTSFSYDNATSRVTSVQSAGGIRLAALNLAANMQTDAAGGELTMQDLEVQMNTDGGASVYGHIVGQALNGEAVDYQGALFSVTAANISGDNSIPSAAHLTFANLSLTLDAFSSIAQAFGAAPESLAYASLAITATRFGTLSVSVENPPLMPKVPEPASWALMALGLVGLAAAHGKRARQWPANSDPTP